jgi:cytochrome P450
MKTAHPPGPSGLPFIGSAAKIVSPENILLFLEQNARQYGDISHFSAFGMQFYFVNHPDYIQQVLVTDSEKYYKDRMTKLVGKKFLGNGLIFNEGEFHKKQRKLIQPAFHHNRLKTYVDQINEITNAWLDRIENSQVVSIHPDMMKLTLAIVCKALFNTRISDGETGHTVEQAMDYFHEVMGIEARSVIPIPDSLPIPRKRRLKRSIHDLQQVVRGIITENRAKGGDDGSLISMMMSMTDEHDRPAMDDRQVMDESITLFMAGHETSALALTWACYLLARHPEIQQKLQHEVKTALDGRRPTMEDMPRLPFTTMVIKEILRLYPPGWILGREPIEPTMIGPYPIPKGAIIFISPYVAHRDARFFDDPDTFRPERFDPVHEKDIPRYAYFPFGGGSRICMGAGFATMEMQLVLVTIAQRFTMQPTTRDEVGVVSGLTLLPDQPINLSFQKINQASA